MLNQLHLGDCLDLMRQLPDGSVDCIISDPPYHTTALHYDRAPAIDWGAWWREAWRVVKPAGVVVLFAADLFTVDLILSQRRRYRYRMVWQKTRATGFLRANKQPLKGHEDILVFGRMGNSSTYNPQKTAPLFESRPRRANRRNCKHYIQPNSTWTPDDGSRHPTSVLYFPGGHNGDTIHPNQKPVPLLSWLVRTYTNAGQVVLDTFAGSATTAVACLAEGRQFICCERDEMYFNKAQARIAQAQPAHAL